MPPRHKQALELLCLVIKREPKFKKWFEGLLACPENLRISAILQMTTAMRHDDEDDSLIGAIASLCDPSLLAAVKHTLDEI